MAHRGRDRGPYAAAVRLHQWGQHRRLYVDGILVRAGHDPDEVPPYWRLAVSYSLLVDMVDGWVDREKVFAQLDDALGEPLIASRDTWGTGPRAERGMRAMMAFVGGPAPPRKS